MTSPQAQIDFLFVDNPALASKDAQVSMEHPFFSLSKKPDRTIRVYEHNGNTITIRPSLAGMPTIWDKEILIFCCSQIVHAMNRGETPSQTIRTTAYRLLKETHRSIGIHGYELLEEALERLRSVTIKTNIRTAAERTREGFGLINAWRIVEKHDPNPRMISLEIELSTWLYRAILHKEILTLHRDYFTLKGGIERRLYELCRKHCGTQASWSIGLDLLHKKSGSRSARKVFTSKLKPVIARDRLPEYRLKLKGDKLLVFYSPAGGDVDEIMDIREILDGLGREVTNEA